MIKGISADWMHIVRSMLTAVVIVGSCAGGYAQKKDNSQEQLVDLSELSIDTSPYINSDGV